MDVAVVLPCQAKKEADKPSGNDDKKYLGGTLLTINGRGFISTGPRSGWLEVSKVCIQ